MSPIRGTKKRAESGNFVASMSFRLFGHKLVFQFHTIKTLKKKFENENEGKESQKHFRSDADEERSFEFLMIRNDTLGIDLVGDEIEKLVDDYDYETLQKYDQFYKLQQSAAQENYSEALTKFNPIKSQTKKAYTWPLRILHKERQ